MLDSTASLPDGRSLSYTDVGDAGGPCAFYFHGAPTSRLDLVSADAELAALGVRIVSPDRPGYGGSSPAPGRTIETWPADVAALADSLGVERFAVIGLSSGGPYAVACSATLGDRVVGGAVFGGATDMAWPAAWEGYVQLEIDLMRAANEEDAINMARDVLGEDGSNFLSASGMEMPEPDMALFADEAFATAMFASLSEAFRQGVAGYGQDIYVQGRPWAFDPGNVKAPFEVLHGEFDTLVPRHHSEHTADIVAGATLTVLPGHGHLSAAGEIPAIAARLLA